MAIYRRQHDARKPAIDHRFNNFDLAAGIDFEGGRIPLDLEMKFTRGFDRAGMDRLPENMVRTLGNNADDAHLRPPACDRRNESHNNHELLHFTYLDMTC